MRREALQKVHDGVDVELAREDWVLRERVEGGLQEGKALVGVADVDGGILLDLG